MTASVFTSLSGATSVGAGTSKIFDELQTIVSMQISWTGEDVGQTLSGIVNLEGSLDGTTWSKIGYANVGGATYSSAFCQINSGIEFTLTFPIPMLGLRANLVSLTGGTSPTVTAIIACKER